VAKRIRQPYNPAHGWLCEACGHYHEGENPPDSCELCAHTFFDNLKDRLLAAGTEA
jgi:rubredoxin